MLLLRIFALLHMSSLATSLSHPATVTIKNDNPLIYFHGRWDSSPGTWWASSGFKLNVLNLKSLTLNLGEHTTSPAAAIGISIEGSAWVTVNVTEGSNIIPIPSSLTPERVSSSLVKVNVEGWQNNRINLESIVLNADAVLLPYEASSLAFQFIGDSLSAGQYLPEGVNQAWPFLVSEHFQAENRINAQPGAALTDILSYGNVHGVSYQFFRTEDTGFYYTADHNFTTPWDFSREHPKNSHVVIHIGANDASQGISDDEFVQVYSDFIAKLRILNPVQPFFIFTPWGWPNSDGSVSYYYDGQYQKIVENRKALGDHHIFLVNTTGWVTYADVFPDNQHPNVDGHIKVANEFITWLAKWGLSV